MRIPATDTGERLIGRMLRIALGLGGDVGLTAEEVCEAVLDRGMAFPLANGWRLACRRAMGADRGYFDRGYLGAVDRAGGYFVMRASASVNPKVRGAYTWEGEALEEWSGQLLKQGILSKGETVDLDVVWGRERRRWS